MSDKPLGMYRHYKGGIYEVLMYGTHTETEETLVVYKDQRGRVWVRPKSMFFEVGHFIPSLPHDIPRFKKI